MTMKCENCGNEHDGSYGSGRFCCESCKQSFIGSNCKCICKYCGKEFNNSRSLGGHARTCMNNPNRLSNIASTKKALNEQFNERNPIEHHILECSVCGKTYELDVRHNQFENGEYRHTCSDSCAHSRTEVSEETRRKQSIATKTYLEKHGFAGCIKKSMLPDIEHHVCEQCNTPFDAYRTKKLHLENNPSTYYSKRFCSKKCSDEHRHNVLSKKALNRCAKGEFGGKNNETYKKHKHGWYHGLYCGSSWELAFVLWMEHNGFSVRRSDKVLEYEYEGKIFKYYPDYEVNGKTYEIKGFADYKAEAKHKAFPWIEYYDREKMKPIIKEVKLIFGKNFVDLLEDNK